MSRAGRPSVARETPAARTRRVRKIIRILEGVSPDTQLALSFSTPLELLIALILAAQCTDARVNQVTAALFPRYRRPEDWARLPRETLEQEIRSTGFYRNKAKTIQACCTALIERFGSRVPDRLEDLLTLPGVGRKTANILRGNVFGQPAIGVDTHVARLAQRLGLTTHTDPDKIEFDLNAVVPDPTKVRFCTLMQRHGRAMCLARKPDCPACPVRTLCPFPTRTGQARPGRRKKK